MGFWFLGGFVASLLFLEVNYFLRMCLSVFMAKIKKRAHVLDTLSVGGICLTTDLDLYFSHMNNSRYLRELDFVRVDFYERTNLFKTIMEHKGAIVQGASTIRYRRFIKTFSRYYITSKIVYWNANSIFMEHKFVGKSDGFIHAIVYCRQRLIDCSAEEVMEILLKTHVQSVSGKVENGDVLNGEVVKMKPEMPIEIAKWVESNDISSANLRIC